MSKQKFPLYVRDVKTKDLYMIENLDYGRMIRVINNGKKFIYQFCDISPLEASVISNSIASLEMPVVDGDGLVKSNFEPIEKETWLRGVQSFLGICQAGLLKIKNELES